MKQITEDYVSYEIAKLLKEKGFNEEVRTFYNSNGKIEDCAFLLNHNLDIGSGFTSAPSQSIVLKWVREVHSIYITSDTEINDKHCFYPVIYTMTEESWDMQSFEELEKLSFNNPEQAVEAAILYVLKNLI